jgi:phenylpropionate dioxygenase-like ring-hydroxylating dioxygenase large terminal subunit
MTDAVMDLVGEPVWRRFWYPVAFAEDLESGPVGRVVLGEEVVLWRTPDGGVSAAIDRCPHRDARLSQGWITGGELTCPYHGWRYDPDGVVSCIPQTPELRSFPPKFRLQPVHARLATNVAWICLGEPILDLPAVPDPTAPGARFVREFDEVWNASAPRLMENSFDPAHTVFVHRGSFGDQQKPDVATPWVERTAAGFVMHSDLSVANPKIAHASTGESGDKTMRSTSTELHGPFLRVLRIAYPSGRVHQIVMGATPVDNQRLRLVQWAVRNDTEEEAPAEAVVAFDRQVTWEDQRLLEGITYPYSPELSASVHIRVDRATIELRRVYRAIRAGTWPEPPGTTGLPAGSVAAGSVAAVAEITTA